MRRLRETAGLSLEDIAAETKISQAILRSLEAGEFRFLPQKVFCRNFVAQYAAVVGAAPEQVVASFEQAWERFQLASGSYPDLVVEDEPLVRTVRWRFWGPLAAAVVIMLLASAFIFRTSFRQQDIAGRPQTRHDVRASAVTTPVARERPPTPSPVVPPTAGPSEPEMVSIIIRVRPESECWVHYRDHDGAAGGKLLSGGAKERMELAGPVKLTIGDAGAASLEVAGRVYEDLGRPGQVVHAEVSEEGLVVLGPRSGGE